MAVVERMSHRVAVMYLGEIVEIGPRRAVFDDPQHAYTSKAHGRRADPRSRAPPGERSAGRRGGSQARFRPAGYAPPARKYRAAAEGHYVMV